MMDDKKVIEKLQQGQQAFEKVIRSGKQIFCLTLIRTEGEFYAPKLLLNLRSEKGETIKKVTRFIVFTVLMQGLKIGKYIVKQMTLIALYIFNTQRDNMPNA